MIIYDGNNKCIYITDDTSVVKKLEDKGIKPNGEIKSFDNTNKSTMSYYYKVTDKFLAGVYEVGITDGYHLGRLSSM